MPKRFFFFFISSLYLFGQTSGDQIAFQNALSAPTDSLRLIAFDKFIAENPTSTLLPNAYAAKFQLYSNQKNDSAAFASVRKYLSLIDSSQIVPSLNAVAYEFAQRKFFLDSAASFINQAIRLYKNDEPVLFNTKAFVLYQLKRYDEAEKIQQKVITLLPQGAEYDSRHVPFFIQLGFIQLESKDPISGVKKIILGNIILPKQSVSVKDIDSLIELKKMPTSQTSFFRDSLYEIVVSGYIRNSRDSVMAKSMLAVSLSRNNVLKEKALNFAKESFETAQQRTIEERSGAAGALGLTYYNMKQYANAERYLSEAAKFASPNESEIFFSLGDVKEKLGKKKEAFDVYISGITTSRPNSVYENLLNLKNELFPTLSLDSIIVARQAALLQFVPEEFHRTPTVVKKNEYEKIVLAELFTGSECKPCQAADIAFDYLIERFKTSSLAILEYHLHIPQPDPLSNSDAEKRAEYYNINSTPTAIFGGNTIVTSGGNKLAAKSKFFLYSDVIEKKLITPSTVGVTLSTTLKKNILSVKADAITASKINNLRLRIAIVEDEVFYKGANGIERHKFVVRKMLRSNNGYSFPVNGKLRVNESVNMNTLIAELKKYYEQTNELYAQRGAKLHTAKYDIDLKRLAVVAFIQDDATREIVQARVIKVD